jgi:MerR family transcriptional regulator, heat shock protein HspR
MGQSGRFGAQTTQALCRFVVAAPTKPAYTERERWVVADVARERAGRDARRPRDAEQAVYVISVAAELTGMHPQTLRIYERKGLLDPSRTSGGSRRFSEADLERLRHIQRLTATGLNLEGVRRVLALEGEVARLRAELAEARAAALEAVAATHRQYRRDLVPLRQTPVPYRAARRRDG